MYNELMDNLEKQLDPEQLAILKTKNIHLGIFSEPYVTYILNGQKTIESRFSQKKMAPYNQISKDDVIFVKKSGGDVVLYFTIKKVLFFELNARLIKEIKEKYNKRLCTDEAFWQAKKDSRYATIIFIDQIIPLKPFHINKKGMQTWLLLKKEP